MNKTMRGKKQNAPPTKEELLAAVSGKVRWFLNELLRSALGEQYDDPEGWAKVFGLPEEAVAAAEERAQNDARNDYWPNNLVSNRLLEKVDLSKMELLRKVDRMYEYAVNGRVPPDTDFFDLAIGSLAVYEDVWGEFLDVPEFHDIYERTQARYHLDAKESLDVKESFSVPALAKLAGIEESTLRNKISLGEVASVRKGQQTVILSSEATQWLSSRKGSRLTQFVGEDELLESIHDQKSFCEYLRHKRLRAGVSMNEFLAREVDSQWDELLVERLEEGGLATLDLSLCRDIAVLYEEDQKEVTKKVLELYYPEQARALDLIRFDSGSSSNSHRSLHESQEERRPARIDWDTQRFQATGKQAAGVMTDKTKVGHKIVDAIEAGEDTLDAVVAHLRATRWMAPGGSTLWRDKPRHYVRGYMTWLVANGYIKVRPAAG